MTISATYIGTSTVQVTVSNLTNSSATTFIQLIDTVTDAIIGTAAAAAGTTNTTAYLAGTVQSPGAGSATATTFSAGGLTGTQSGSGWTLFDCIQTGYVITQVFRCLNKDGVSYKAAILRWNLNAHELNISTCEYWDTQANFNTSGTVAALTSRNATNEAFTYFDCAQLGFKMDVTDFIVMATPRWLSIVTYVNGEPCCWSGVFESAREDIMDVSTIGTGVPCWGWMSSSLPLLGATAYNAKPLGTLDYTLWSMPRVKNGSNGYLAAKGWAADFGVTNHPIYLNATAGNYTNTAPAFFYFLGNQVNRYQSNSWDTTKRLILPIKPIADYNLTYVSNYGTLYGIKALSPAGNYLNRVKLQADSDGNYSPSGTLRDHFLLNLHHKTFGTDETAWFSNSNWLATSIVGNTSARPIYICSTGSAYYTITEPTTNNSIVKYNAVLNTSPSTPFTATGGATLYDIKFDGERYVYIGTSTGMSRLDIRDDSIVTLAISGGVYTFVIAPTYIFAAGAGQSATPTVTRVLRSNFTVDTASTFGFTAGSVVLSTFNEATCRLIDGVLDFDGNVWFAPCVATGGNFKLVKIVPNSGITYPTLGSTAAATTNVALHVLDSLNILIYQIASSGTTFYQTQYNPRTSVQTGATTVAMTGAAYTNYTKMYTAKVDGVVMVYPRLTGAAGTIGVRTTLCATTGSAITTSNGIVVLTAPAQTGANAISNTNHFTFYDGTRLISNNSTGLTVYTNVHGVNCASGVTLGQLAIAA